MVRISEPRSSELQANFAWSGEWRPPAKWKNAFPLGARVAVDQHRLGAALAGLAAIDAPLAAGTKARVVGPWPVDLRRLAFILLEAGAHFAPKLFLQPSVGARTASA